MVDDGDRRGLNPADDSLWNPPASFPHPATVPPVAMVWDRILRAEQVGPRGMIHIGAHRGQEIVPYLMLGFEKILLLEPQPDVFQQLEANVAYANTRARAMDAMVGIAPHDRIHALRCAAGSSTGEIELQVMNFSGMTSTLSPRLDAMQRVITNRAARASAHAGTSPWVRDYMPNLTKAPIVERRAPTTAPLRTLDEILESDVPPGWSAADFNVLRINVQGAEREVLGGARQLLRGVDVVSCEVDLAARYEGGATRASLDETLRAVGFVFRRGWVDDEDVADVVYARRRA